MDPSTIRRVEWRQLFPWLRLFGAFRIAIDPRKLILAVLGLCFVTGGNHAIDQIGLAPLEIHEYPWTQFESHQLADGIEPLSYLTDPGGLRGIFFNWKVLIDPLLEAAVPPALVLTNSHAAGFAASVDALLRLLWFAFVWGIFGGAITRMAVHQFVKDEKLSMSAGVKFSCGKILDYLAAPLLPLGGTLILLLMCAGVGFLGRIPVAGPIMMTVLLGLTYLFSVGIVIMLIGVGAGWPLMVAAISTENSDGFDGFSRAHSYIFDVPWQYLWCFVLSMLYASATVFFVELAGGWIHQSATLGLKWGLGTAGDIPSWGVAGQFSTFWFSTVSSLIVGYRVSLFWVLFLLIYLVLRYESDRIPINEAFLEFSPVGQEDEMALGGVGATNEEVSERPVVNPDEPDEAANLSDDEVSEEKPEA